MHATAYAAQLNGTTQETTQKNHNNVEKICAVLKDKPFISILKLSEECGMSNKEVRTIIDKLKEDGILYRVGSRKDGCWVILTDDQKTEQEKGK